MATKRSEHNPILSLSDDGDGTWRAEYALQRYRFLMSDGSTIDVWGITADSYLREAVLEHTKVERIEGVARITT